MRISVIIPVYNAERFLEASVRSALDQPEVDEVVLVEDGSPDNSLDICRSLAERHDRVTLVRHPGGENRGAGASRNLGVRAASNEIVAFLDADDFYLPGRFRETCRVLAADDAADGVYEAVGHHYENECAKDCAENKPRLTTMTRRVAPENLFEAQAPVGNDGYCQTSGWTLRKRALDKSGYFDEHLRLHQDTALFVKLAATARLMPGQLDAPIAMRRVHSANRITAPRSDEQKLQDRLLMWQALASWAPGRVSRRRQFMLFRKWLYCYMDGPSPRIAHPIWRKPFGLHRMLYFLLVRVLPLPTCYPIRYRNLHNEC